MTEITVGNYIHVGDQVWKVDNAVTIAKKMAKAFAAGKPYLLKCDHPGGEIIIIPNTGVAVWFDHPQNSDFW